MLSQLIRLILTVRRAEGIALIFLRGFSWEEGPTDMFIGSERGGFFGSIPSLDNYTVITLAQDYLGYSNNPLLFLPYTVLHSIAREVEGQNVYVTCSKPYDDLGTKPE